MVRLNFHCATYGICVILTAFMITGSHSIPSVSLKSSRPERHAVELRQSTPLTCPLYTCVSGEVKCGGDLYDTACKDCHQICSEYTCDCAANISQCLANNAEKFGNCVEQADEYFKTCQGICVTDSDRCTLPQVNATLDICVHGQYCSRYWGKCYAQHGVGGYCESSIRSECGNPQHFDLNPFTTGECIEQKCTRIPHSSDLGDGCSSTNDCAVGLTCDYSVCQGGMDVGGKCNTTQQCNFGLYCSWKSECTVQLQLGEECTFEENEFSICQIGLICSREGKCITEFSKAAGEACIIGASECGSGTTCDPITKECGQWEKGDHPCTDDSECPLETSCKCDHFSGKQVCTLFQGGQMFDPQCIDRLRTLQQCAQANQCRNYLTDSRSSCMANKCPDEASCALPCFYQAVYKDQIDSGCYELPADTHCSLDQVSSSEDHTGKILAGVLIPVGGILVCVAVFAGTFLYFKRKTGTYLPVYFSGQRESKDPSLKEMD